MSNSISFVGRLGRDAEIKQIGDSSVCKFSVASDVGFGDKKITNWFFCDLWGKRGDALCQYLAKGTQVFIIGTLTIKEKDGKTYVGVKVNEVEMLSKSNGNQNSGEGNNDDNDNVPF